MLFRKGNRALRPTRLSALVWILGTAISCSETSDRTAEGDLSGIATQRIVFFGNSITAGYGIDEADAFPALIQDRIDELGWPYLVHSAGVSGETSAGGLRRIDQELGRDIDVFVLELGANDGMRGIPTAGIRHNLKLIVDKVRRSNPDVDVVIAGMKMPAAVGPGYAREFNRVFERLATETDAQLIPFILEDVAGKRRLNQMDGIHPTARGHAVIAETVWSYLQPVLRKRLARLAS